MWPSQTEVQLYRGTGIPTKEVLLCRNDPFYLFDSQTRQTTHAIHTCLLRSLFSVYSKRRRLKQIRTLKYMAARLTWHSHNHILKHSQKVRRGSSALDLKTDSHFTAAFKIMLLMQGSDSSNQTKTAANIQQQAVTFQTARKRTLSFADYSCTFSDIRRQSDESTKTIQYHQTKTGCNNSFHQDRPW